MGMDDWMGILREQLAGRQDPWVVLEGQGVVEAALAGWWEVAGVMIAEDHSWEAPAWSGMEVVRESREAMDELAGGDLHGGVIGLAKRPVETGEVAAFVRSLEADALVVVCPRLDNAVAAGEAIRLSVNHGAAGILFGAEGVSPFDPAVVRVAAEALFQLPVRIADSGLLLRSLKAAGVELCGWEPSGLAGLAVTEGRRALVMGDPVHGLGPFWRAACDTRMGGLIGEVMAGLAAGEAPPD